MTTILTEMSSRLDQYLLCSTLLQPGSLKTPYSRYTTVHFVAPEDHEPIDAIVDERQSQITDLTHEIKRVQMLCQKLRAVETKLKEGRTRVQESQRFHRALMSPIRRLSPEILAEIFCHCLPENPPIPHAKTIPLVLTRVCQRWRSIAMATPQLWSSLTIPIRQVVNDEYRLQYDTWMARAKSVPLVLVVENIYHIDPLMITPCLLDWLRRLFNRCCDFFWRGYFMAGLLTGSCVMELLERLKIYYFERSGSPSIDIDSNASRLRSVSLSLPNNADSIDRITLPWSQLTGLDMYGVELRWADIFRLFEICTCLQGANFSLPYEDDLQAVIPGSVINHSLKLLAIDAWVSRLGGLLFDALVLPSLEELEIAFHHPDDDRWPHTQFTSFLTRSGRPLKKLEVCGKNSVSDYLSEYRALLPSCTFKIL
ncbi:hypothetical protein F5I97DRAFT_2060025 [Phlebopus sp. FC_14]|nr:hypothetical protein F5I97DRAFT_2060025 [Phlebopus sp. FC_14]